MHDMSSMQDTFLVRANSVVYINIQNNTTLLRITRCIFLDVDLTQQYNVFVGKILYRTLRCSVTYMYLYLSYDVTTL